MADIGLIVAGPAGRMGQTLVRMIANTPGLVLAGALARPGASAVGEDCGRLTGLEPTGILVTDNPDALPAAQAILDFTTPATALRLAELAAHRHCVLVTGTTGFSGQDLDRLKEAACETCIVHSGNMGLGVSLLAAVVERAARSLDADFDIEILEMHHNRKVDAPSGTALLLGKAAADGRGSDFDGKAARARNGHAGPRERGSIGVASLRGGSVIGSHTVIFAGEHERIEFRHQAESRAMYAKGALKAAIWGRTKAAGLYTMADVLGLVDL